MSGPLLEVEGLSVSFGAAPAVRNVSLGLDRGECLALVGESGSGKSVTAMSVIGLLPRSASVRAERIAWRGSEGEIDLSRAAPLELRRVRGAGIATIFQEPMTSLNPVLSIGAQIVEALRLHRGLKGRAAREAAAEALDAVGIPEPRARLGSFPHEFSGGMRQRAMIAIALSCEPALLIADEPTTALDVTVQAQILDLIDRLRSERGLAVLLITHDLGVAAQRAGRVAVMYGGRVVETGPIAGVLREPAHPYTRALLGSIPRLDRRAERLPTVRVTPEDSDLGGGLRGWWPTHERPAGASGGGDDAGGGTMMIPRGEGRRVLVWATPAARRAVERAGGKEADACGC